MGKRSYTIKELAYRAEMAPRIVRDLFDTIIAVLEEGESVSIHGFGHFEVDVEEKGGERVKVVSFRMSPVLGREWRE